MTTTALLIFNAALLFMVLTAGLASVHDKTWTEVMSGICGVVGSAANRIKVVIGGVVVTVVGLYDVITAGGIDLDHILQPILGDRFDVGRLLATVGLTVTVLRFVMQSGMFKANNINGLDNPEEK